MLVVSCRLGIFERRDEGSAAQEGDRAEDSKAAVDQSPWEWNAAYVTSDESEWNDSGTSDQAKGDDPLIADRVAVGADEEKREYEMGECEPIGTIRQEGIARIGVGERVKDDRDPRQQMRSFRDRLK